MVNDNNMKAVNNKGFAKNRNTAKYKKIFKIRIFNQQKGFYAIITAFFFLIVLVVVIIGFFYIRTSFDVLNIKNKELLISYVLAESFKDHLSYCYGTPLRNLSRPCNYSFNNKINGFEIESIPTTGCPNELLKTQGKRDGQLFVYITPFYYNQGQQLIECLAKLKIYVNS